MNPFKTLFSSKTIVNEFKPLDQIQDPRLEKLVGRSNGRLIEVSSGTLAIMAKANDVLIKVAHDTFPDGPGNQKSSIIMSGGRSWMRMLLTRTELKNTSEPSQETEAKTAKFYGGGNCGEYSLMVATEMCRRSNTLPVSVVHDNNLGHAYTIIGDWRDRNTGDMAIVADAWQGIKKVHTYGERFNPDTPIAFSTIPPGQTLSPSMKNALGQTPLSNRKIEEKLYPELGLHPEIAKLMDMDISKEASKNVLAMLESSNNLWDYITSCQDVHTVYFDNEGNYGTFNSTTEKYINDYLNSRDVFENL